MGTTASWTIRDATGSLRVDHLPDGRRGVSVELASPGARRTRWTTPSSDELIRLIAAVKGTAWTCDELMRLEDPTYLRRDLEICLGAYVDHDELDGARILDFGSGSGASSVLLATMYPGAQIVGVELVAEHLDIAERRVAELGLTNVTFLRSPSPDRLPDDLGTFDAACFNAVWEHLLPDERRPLLSQVWQSLRPGGVLFVNQTPDRRFPVELHTTGLPLVNYLPLRSAAWAARRWSPRVADDASTDELLRTGLRGGTIRELDRAIASTGERAEWLRPAHLGLGRQAQLWYRIVGGRPGRSRAVSLAFGAAERLRLPVAPYLSLAARRAVRYTAT